MFSRAVGFILKVYRVSSPHAMLKHPLDLTQSCAGGTAHGKDKLRQAGLLKLGSSGAEQIE